MKPSYIDVNGVKTKVVTWGKDLDELKKCGEEDLIVVIPGNPGITRFYTMFLQTVYEQVPYPIVIIGHAGHEPPANEDLIPPLKGNECLYGLQGQIDHKNFFIKNYISDSARIHFIGHSIGTYIILQLLKDPSIRDRVVANYLLFPTFERMAETNNGFILNKLVYPILWLIYIFSAIFTVLPSFLQAFLVYTYFKLHCWPKMHIKAAVNLVNPRVLRKVFFMAYEELDEVQERDDDLIKNNVKRIKFLYGMNDNWAPASYHNKLKQDIPEVDAELSNFDHSFVLKLSRDVGNVVAGWLKEKM